MFKNCAIKRVKLFRPGFTLVELQIYLGVMSVLVVMVCQIALMYHHMYDKISVSAQHSVMMLAAIFQVNESFDYAVMHKSTDGKVFSGSFLKKNKLVGVINNRQAVILDGVTSFEATLDIQAKQLQGAFFACDYKGKRLSWYRAAFTKVFSCSSSL